jgi:energy-coupling factor transporter transmembrane protein EcfT
MVAPVEGPAMHLDAVVKILATLVVLYLAFVLGGLVLRLFLGLLVLLALGLVARRLFVRRA